MCFTVCDPLPKRLKVVDVSFGCADRHIAVGSLYRVPTPHPVGVALLGYSTLWGTNPVGSHPVGYSPCRELSGVLTL